MKEQNIRLIKTKTKNKKLCLLALLGRPLLDYIIYANCSLDRYMTLVDSPTIDVGTCNVNQLLFAVILFGDSSMIICFATCNFYD
jgi:hypothetical protein